MTVILPSRNVSLGVRGLPICLARSEVLEKITRLPFQDPVHAEKEDHRRATLSSSTVNIGQIQFGWLTRDGVFSIEWEHLCIPTGELRFNSQEAPEILISAQTNETISQHAFIRIRLTSIRYLSVHFYTDPSQPWQPIIYLMLYNSPSFETRYTFEDNSVRNQRVSYLPFPEHERLVSYISGVLRLVCTSAADLNLFQSLYYLAQARPAKAKGIDREVIPVDRLDIFNQSMISTVNTFVKRVDWNVAFQVEYLVRHLLVDVKEMVILIPEIRSLIRLKGSAYAAAVLQGFRSKVQDWYDEKEEYDGIVECFNSVFKTYAKEGKQPKDDPNVFISYHLSISPTTQWPDGPFTERSNRIIRWYPSRHEYFLKVRFTDEEEVKHRYDRNVDREAYFRTRIRPILAKGLIIAGRVFKFLAYTQSSLKEHTVWFLRPFYDDELDCIVDSDAIIRRIGIFDSEELRRCPALYGARISQAFTATEASLVEVEETHFLDDKLTHDERYNFTDGVGTMSREFALEVFNELKGTRRRTRNRTDLSISAFQIRFGGSKGMLSVDYKLKGSVICVRPSMRKFTTPLTNSIEIAQFFDRPLKLCLNRPLVMLLEDLGIPYETFKHLQDRAIQQTLEATENLDAAARLLETFGLGNSFRLVPILLGLCRLGVDNLIQSETFHRSMLEYAIHHILRELKHHTRIPVEGAWNLVGVADVHGYLRNKEIFACVKPPNGPIQYLEGDVLITRSPVIHPGDVQLVRAIGEPPPGSCFDHEPLINTVVFPIKGTRPLPSMLGGGDLDGDTYNVIPLKIHPGLRPERTMDPANYERPTRKLLEQDCSLDDVAEFIVEYFHSDLVGLIATRWLIIADQNVEGIFHNDCIKLAQLHSDAVDFPKTGQPVNPDDIPRLHFLSRPDWYAPENINSDSSLYYKSQRAIGKLARAIALEDIEPSSTVHRPDPAKRDPDKPKMRPGYPGRPSTVFRNLETFIQDDELYSLLQARLGQFGIALDGDDIETAEILAIYEDFIELFENAATSFSLSSRTVLAEEEVLLGTIAARTSHVKDRREKIARLRSVTQQMVNDIRADLAGNDVEDLRKISQRAWMAWQLAREQVKQGTFGARSFQFVALGLLLSSIKDLEDDDERFIRKHKRKGNIDSELDWKRSKWSSTQREAYVENEYDME
ncbi:hypothetical protein GYMLUDRAFT_212277 [Collybiopsis luxurians FD-317 M1]|nr:hypothetical protein GYMLUDRAFT_212277 [Collybiopsis luxurians FD-317 M1]